MWSPLARTSPPILQPTCNFFTTCARTLARLRVEEDLQDQLLAERQEAAVRVRGSQGWGRLCRRDSMKTLRGTMAAFSLAFSESERLCSSPCPSFLDRILWKQGKQWSVVSTLRGRNRLLQFPEKQWKAAIDHPQGIAVRSNGVETKSKLEKGTCLNKADNVMFKQIVFELDFTVCKLKLMLSWVVVCDVWYVEPQINDALLGDRNELKLRKSLEILRPISKLTEEEQLNVVPLLVFQINMSVRKSGLSYGFFLHGPETPLDHAKKIKNKDKFKASMIRQQHVLSGHICGFQLSDRPKSCWMALKSVKK
ncbi:hypothetical protein SELMODRAFT_418535 [Selaginella moellendorffii]|uniref:Uncharacterized protein n=1 Tax=Selaginella moellendorffii TaxID=88036 RepID=D8S609_SELML|nr:hypothetical protein SELMODRAFT_418535 [Selaginella moellendorffii]